MKNIASFLVGLAAALLLVWANVSYAKHSLNHDILFGPIGAIAFSLLMTMMLFMKKMILATKQTTRLAFLSLGALIGFSAPYVFVYFMLAA